ncbi:MAG: hypothetical protein BJ554DRAFT_4318 [Olpidium bornovanus]|uniref:Uncharacterized protein n=1 Tax=Olpidium bornovanus TaxID=278681 RepID=A0A8H8DFB0_9FUNG|nr:MAG: hypothetical protein BJ554DRAFT_4318 [Olpidium bornovanus]
MDSYRHEAAPFSPLTWLAAEAGPAVGALPQAAAAAAAAPNHRRPVLPHAPPEESKKKRRRRETREGLARAQLEFVANREK